jgi:hypothetical protein
LSMDSGAYAREGVARGSEGWLGGSLGGQG